ncbi:hypothetical protein ACWDPV_21870 [Gordonia sp. NPDC003504]
MSRAPNPYCHVSALFGANPVVIPLAVRVPPRTMVVAAGELSIR